jgi:hypothetical protein
MLAGVRFVSQAELKELERKKAEEELDRNRARAELEEEKQKKRWERKEERSGSSLLIMNSSCEGS